MIQSNIIDDLVTKTGLVPPEHEDEIESFIKRIISEGRTRSNIWNTFLPTTQNYLQRCIKSFKSSGEIPLPQDLTLAEGTNSEILSNFYAKYMPDRIDCRNDIETMSLNNIFERRDTGFLQVPYFQRKLVWKPREQEDFIESYLSGIPISNILLAADPKRRREQYLIDGRQRITTLQNFYQGIIKWKGLRFKDLPYEVQNQYLYSTFSVIIANCPREDWPTVFRRVNSGGRPLNDIEIRRVAFDEYLMDDLDSIAENNEHWKAIFGNNSRHRGLHALLRATAMHFQYRDYVKPLTTHLDNFCKDLPNLYGNNTINAVYLDNLDRVIMASSKVLGREAFRRMPDKPVHLGVLDLVLHAGLTALEQKPKLSSDKLGDAILKAKDQCMMDAALMEALKVATTEYDNVTYRLSAAETSILQIIKG